MDLSDQRLMQIMLGNKSLICFAVSTGLELAKIPKIKVIRNPHFEGELNINHMSPVMRKPVLWVSDQV